MTSPTDITDLRDVTMLVVEDDLDALDFWAMHFESLGAHVTRATNIASARAALVASRYDVLVSDLALPDGTGHDLMRELGNRVGAAIALTGQNDPDAFALSRKVGFLAHLIKPCSAKVLDQTVARLAGMPPLN